MKHTDFITVTKDELLSLNYDRNAEILRVLGHPIRIKILVGLTYGGCNVKNMVECLDLPQATISQHLAILRNLGIIKGDREGNQVIYQIKDDYIFNIINETIEDARQLEKERKKA